MSTTHGGSAALLIAALLLGVFLGSSCATVRLISAYDEPTDRALTALQQSTETFISALMAQPPSANRAFTKHTLFYDDADHQLRRLEFRVSSIPHNTHTARLVARIRVVILGEAACSAAGSSLRDLHCLEENAAQGPSKEALEIARRNVNQAIGAALALEIAKKQGLDTKE